MAESCDHSCHCAYAESPHCTGDGACPRIMTEAPILFADDPDRKEPVYIVDGQLIGEFTLKEQRGYHRHPCGCWSRWKGTVNSLPDET